MYNWQHPDWPAFSFDQALVNPLLDAYNEELSKHLVLFNHLPEADRLDVQLATSVEEGVRSSYIEGENINREDVRSSLLNNLRFGPGERPVLDMRAKGLAAMLRAAMQQPGESITEVTLRYWHELLFRGLSYPGMIGHYRTSKQPMEIVSGPDYKREVHYVAPPADRVPKMMKAFVKSIDQKTPTPIRAGIAHLHFESIHPFADGNGRIGRALLERMLLEPFGGFPILSISHAIQLTRKDYYAALKSAQSSLNATEWLLYFFGTARQAIVLNQELTRFTLRKVKFFARYRQDFTDAQAKALRKMWAAGPEGFQGGMNAKKYVRITRVSPATATRDLRKLTDLGALERRGAGRSTHYVLRDAEDDDR